MMDYKTIRFAESENVGTITLNRPERLNAINEAMVKDLSECIGYCSTNSDIRAIVITGEGRAFCSGGDVLEMEPSRLDSVLDALNSMLLQIRSVPKPVIAAVNGSAVGGGFALALACDIVVAATKAKFNAQWVIIGLPSDCGMSYMLPRLVGDKRAAWLMLTGEMIDAYKGHEMGVVNQVVKDDQLLSVTEGLARRFAMSATLATGAIKELLQRSHGETIEGQMAYEKKLFARLILTDDHREALAAFHEKRKPVFRGR